MLGHAKLFFDDFQATVTQGAPVFDGGAFHDPKLQEYICYLLLDFVTADPELDDMPLAAALERVLDDAVARDPTLAPARALLLMPLRLLDALGKDAPAALGDDTFAMERMRLLLSMASTHVPASIVRDVLGETGGAALTGATAAFDAPLVHVGGLVLIGLAAGRVGASLGSRVAAAASASVSVWRRCRRSSRSDGSGRFSGTRATPGV